MPIRLCPNIFVSSPSCTFPNIKTGSNHSNPMVNVLIKTLFNTRSFSPNSTSLLYDFVLIV